MPERLGQRRCRSRTLAVARTSVTLLFVVFATRSATASPSARLTYVRTGAGAATCPDEAALRQGVAARLGYDPFFPSAQKTVLAEVSRSDKGYRGRVVILDEHGVSRGERVLHPSGADCAETVRAMALAISIAIDDLATEEPVATPTKANDPAPAPTPPPAVPLTPAPESPLPPLPPSPRTEPSVPIELRVSAGPHALAALAPSIAIGARAGGELVVGRFALGVEGRLDAPASSALSGGGRVVTSILGGAIAVCVREGMVFGCALGMAGSFEGRSEGIAQARSDRALLVEVGARAGIEGAVGQRLALRAFAGVEVPFNRHEVQVDGVTRFRLPIAAPMLGADLVLRFSRSP